MNSTTQRLQGILPALWLGMLLTVAGIATASAFAALPVADAGQVVSRVLAREAATSLMLGAAWLALDRLRVRRDDDRTGAAQFNGDVALALGSVFCTVAGYYALQPLMADARQGHSRLSFAQWHAVSLGFYGVKVLLVAALAWRSTAARPARGGFSRSPSS